MLTQKINQPISIYLPILTLLVGLLIASVAAYYSIYGLVLIFSGGAVVMAASLEVGKLIITSVVFNYIKVLPKWLSFYCIVAILILMVITSVGVYGYLSSAYQKNQTPLAQIDNSLVQIDQEKQLKQKRLQQMDDTINSIKSDFVTKRMAERKQQQAERDSLIKRIDELTTTETELKSKKLDTEVHIGPIVKIAQAFDIPSDQAVHYLILLFVIAFDPLAVAMTLCFNIMINNNRKIKQQSIEQKSRNVQPVEQLKSQSLTVEELLDSESTNKNDLRKKLLNYIRAG